MFRFILPAVRRLSYGVSCAIHLAPHICTARHSILILRHAKFGKAQITNACVLLNLAAELYLKFYRYEILKLSSKFRACRISTLKFYGAEFSAEAKREAMFEETNWNMRSRARFEISASTLQEEIAKFGYFSR